MGHNLRQFGKHCAMKPVWANGKTHYSINKVTKKQTNTDIQSHRAHKIKISHQRNSLQVLTRGRQIRFMFKYIEFELTEYD